MLPKANGPVWRCSHINLEHNYVLAIENLVVLPRSHHEVSSVKQILMGYRDAVTIDSMKQNRFIGYMDVVNIESTKQNWLWQSIHGDPESVGCLLKG